MDVYIINSVSIAVRSGRGGGVVVLGKISNKCYDYALTHEVLFCTLRFMTRTVNITFVMSW